jgi:hypothetical protein
MMSRRRFAILVLVFGLAAIPAFSCLTPPEASEMASDSCCVAMNQRCSERMPQAARSCCVSGREDGQPYLSTAARSELVKAHLEAVPVRIAFALPAPEFAASLFIPFSISPPGSSPGANSILRI